MASSAIAASATKQKHFQFAVRLWEVYERSRRRDSAGTVHWPVDKLASIYADFFKEPLKLSDYGVDSVERLLDKVPIFNVGKAGTVSVSREKLLNFLVTPAVETDRVNGELFREKFTYVTGLQVECVYGILGKRNFEAFAQSLKSKSSLFRTKGGGSNLKLFIPQEKQHFLLKQPTECSVSPAPALRSKASRKDTTHRTSLSGESLADLHSPPRKVHCIQPTTSSSLTGQPIRVHISSQQESPLPLLGNPTCMSATKIPPLMERQGRNSHSFSTPTRNHDVEMSERPSQPLPNFLSLDTERDFPVLVAQVPPQAAATCSRGDNIRSANTQNVASGPVVSDNLPPPSQGRITTTHLPPQRSKPQVFPNPSTPDEVVPPAHPGFYPSFVPVTQAPPQAAASRVRSANTARGPVVSDNLPPPSQWRITTTHLPPQRSKPQVFPNPSTPDEVVPPAHPGFYPSLVPASSSLSTVLTFTDRKGRSDPSQVAAKKINARLNAIIDDLASTGKFIPENIVMKFRDQLVQQCRYARCYVNARDVQVFENYRRTHCRVAELIRIFCWMSPITTIYELERALISAENVSTFEELRMGPLIKHPLVAKFFQPPDNLQEIPEITAHQIQKTLMKFLDKTMKQAAARGEKHSLEEFLDFFTKSVSKPSPHHLCVRITSFPLAIQTNFRFRRMQRESRNRVQQKVDEEVKTIVMHETDQVRRKLASLNDPLAVNRHVTAKDPIVLLINIFEIFLNYLSGYQSAKVNGFLQLLSNQQWVRQVFLLAIYKGAYGVERVISDIREDDRDLHQARGQPEGMLHRTHGEILDVVLRQLSRLPFPIDLSSLAAVEKAIADQFAAPSFHVLSSTSFLDFLVANEQCKTSLGGSLTIGAAPIDENGKRKVVEIVSQLRHAERNNQDTVSETLKLQCGVTTMDQIHCGSIEKLISDVTVQEKKGASMATQRHVTHLAPLLVNGANNGDAYKQWSCPSVGVLGHKTREDAISCLQRVPLLEDLSCWSHWDLVFKPQHGQLAEFIEKEGPHGGLHALELIPGTLLRVDPKASHQKFLQALEANDPVNTAGQLVSIVVQQGSVHEVSMQLLGNHVQTILEKLVSDSVQSREGSVDGTLLATQFIFHCLVQIPHKICHFLSKEVFLEPLRRVSSTTAVEDLLKQCKGAGVGRRHLQALGMGLGIKAWTDDFAVMLDEAQNARARVAPKLEPNSAHTCTTLESYDVDGPTCSPDAETLTVPHPTTSPLPTDMEVTTIEPEDSVQNANVSLLLGEAVDAEKEAQCRCIVESIRSEDFGMGLELDGRQKEVAKKQRQREGRGLQRLSKELYSKDTHFVLELIQNADDNSYHESLLSAFSSEDVPALKFTVGPSSVSVLNNELGFGEKNVRAICDVGRSTKGAHHSGYIGQKGIGFKSVFRVTDTPEIHSGGYHIRFDAQCDAIGYILPHWIDKEDRGSAAVGKGWNTTIVLPLKEDLLSMSLVRKFQDVRPSLLLFLHRLRSITVEEQVSGAARHMKRSDSGEGIIKIEHNTDEDKTSQDTWLVVRKQLTNASQFKAEVEITEVALAFPLAANMKTAILAKDLQHQQVFAFLPLRSYGFRFIVQGDFDLPSSREDVNSDSAWNQWMRSEIPQLFLHALERIKRLPGLSLTDAVALYLQFIPLDGELHDFFKPVAIQILNLLRGTACLPTEPGSEDIAEPFSIIQTLSHGEPNEPSSLPHLLKQPSQLVAVRDCYIRKHIPQSLLNSALHLFYLSSELTPFLNSSLQSQLGVQNLSIDHLIAVAEAVLQSYSGGSHTIIMLSDDSEDEIISDSEESDGGIEAGRLGRSTKAVPPSPHTVFVQWVAQWLTCVHIVLEEEGDRSPMTTDKLKKIKIIPLTNGCRLAAQDCSLFFPSDGDSVSSADFKGLFDEIMVVEPILFEVQRDSGANAIVKPSHRVHSVLELLGVSEMYPAEVIRHHILPCFQNAQWKSKSKALLTTYLVYIKDNLGMQGSGITEVEMVSLLRDCVALATKNHGAKQPAREVLHFSSQFQPGCDLEKLFPDVQWMLVSPDYLKSRKNILSWRSFLQKLGVHNKIAVRQFNERVPEGSDRWHELREFVGRSPDGAYTLRDFKCSEFEEIVRSVKSKEQSGHQQMMDLVQLLDKLWDEEYRQYAFAKCYDGSNENYLGGDTSVPSSFHRALKGLAWLPAMSFPSGQSYSKKGQLYRGCDLFDHSKANQRLLDYHVPYIAVELKNPKLLEILQVKCHINAEEMIAFLQEWSQASTLPGTQFRASIAHMSAVYMFLSQYTCTSRGAMGQSIIDKFSDDDLGLIFVPSVHDSHVSSSEHVEGRFYSIHNVCWVDPSGVLFKKQQYNHSLPSELPKVLHLHYGVSDHQKNTQMDQDIKMAFDRFGIRETPTAAAYITTLQFIGSLAPIPQKQHIDDFASIALRLSQVCMQGHIIPDYLQQQLKGKKVFPSHRDLWISLDSCLLEKDNTQLAKFFSECKDVHFLQWPADFQKKLLRYQRYQEQQREDERKHFIDVCGIARLSEVVQTEVVPKGMVEPLESLRKRLHIMVPLMQRHLVANEEKLYQSLQQENLKEKLSKIFIASVPGLDCLYSIYYHGMTYISPPMSSPGSEFVDSSEEDSAVLYVVASKLDSPKCLVPTLVKIFTGKQAQFEDPSLFENLLKDMLLLPAEEMKSILSEPNYNFGEVDDNDMWIVPLHEELEQDMSESEDDEVSIENEEDASAAVVNMEGMDEITDSVDLKSWPPKAPVWTSDSTQRPARPPPPGSSVADVVGDDDIQKISEKYSMSNITAEKRPLSRQSSHDHASSSGLSQSTMRGTDHTQNSSSLPQSHSSVTQSSMSHSTKQQSLGESSEHHEHSTRTRGDTGPINVHPPTREVGGSVPLRNKDQKHKLMKPETAFTQDSFSVASALKSISVDSCRQLHPVHEECDQESQERIGRWGEEYVYKYLEFMKCLPDGQSIQTITWINETLETGKPYDIEVKIDPDTVLYIEVKSTKSPEKELMEFSWNELQFADKEKQNYHLYRVYSAGSALVTLKWIENLSDVLDTRPVRLLLEL